MLVAGKVKLMSFQVHILVRSAFFGQNEFGVLIGDPWIWFLYTRPGWAQCLFEKGLVQGFETGKGEIN